MESIALSERDHDAVMLSYVPDPTPESTCSDKKTAVVIFPGGGYQAHTEWECDRMAQAFSELGFAPFVVQYSVGVEASFPELLQQASRAVWHVRKRADEYGVHPDRIVACGFSAGAHLTTMLATHWQDAVCREGSDIPEEGNKPNATVTGYTPTTFEDFVKRSGLDINSDDGPGHLLSHQQGYSDIPSLTTHTKVSKSTPPAFLWKTTSDFPPGTLEYAMALEAQHIPYELHVFTDSQRCASAAAWSADGYVPNTRMWLTLATNWLTQIFR